MTATSLGNWTSSRGGAAVDGVSSAIFEDLYTCRRLVTEPAVLSIKQACRDKEEIFFTYKSASNEAIRCMSLGELNFVATSSGPVFGSVVGMNEKFEMCSVLLIGPTPGLRIIEHYMVSNNGLDLTVSYTISSFGVRSF